MHELFGTKHLILIAISAVLIVGLYFVARRFKFATVAKTLFCVGIVSEIVKIFYYIVANEEKFGGVLPKTDLPFHLCSIQIIFISVVVLAKSESLKRFIISFMVPSCLFGGIAAIIIATDSSRNSNIITVQYFLYHIAITVFALYVLTGKEYKLDIKDYFNCLKFLLIVMFFAIYINSMLSDGVKNTNFMYVVDPPQKGLPYLNKDNGWLSYILRYAGLILVCVSLCYIKPIINAVKGFIQKRKTAVKENGEN